MNEKIIKNWNNIVTDEDEVYILGDISLSNSVVGVEKFVVQLKGKKHLIVGNHDNGWLKKYKRDGYSFLESIQDYKELKIGGEFFCMMHYPILDWNGKHNGAFMLHGHCHNNSSYNDNNVVHQARIYDVGMDANNYTPISLQDICNKYYSQALAASPDAVHNYELMYIIKPYEDQKKIDKVVSSINNHIDILNNSTDSVYMTDKWGQKHLTYPIGDYTAGYYVLCGFKCTDSLVKDLHSFLDSHNDILRHMIIRKD